jgi:hypothetical protein
VEWTTATEINTVGFNLYRSDSADGPYLKINANLIPASFDSVNGGQYRYEDRNVLSGKTYYYALEDVERTGVMVRHGPIRVTAQASDGSGMMIAAIGVGGLVVLIGGVVFSRRRRRAKIDDPAGKAE